MTLPFHPLVSTWFTETYGKPTTVQEEAWPLIVEGKDILAIAPTGSGKTLTAFLSAISRFIDGSWDPAKLCVLYVSPLKALNEDIRRNLIEPIEALKQRAQLMHCAEMDNPVYRIRVETRSGDTPQSERRRFLLHPPSILAVTPESLAILLLSPKGRTILSTIKYLVIDEIHAVMGTKRGAFLSCQIDRLMRIVFCHGGKSVSFQRIALSATVNPPELAAEFAGGIDLSGKKQKLAIVVPPAKKNIHFTVEFPPEPADTSTEGKFRYGPRYAVLVNYILERIGILSDQKNKKHGSILVFTDSRRRAERITYLLNETAGLANPGSFRVALCHHGSLSKEVRYDVEQNLVHGLVPCVVATSSLELGIDIGEINEVILAGTPSSSSRTLQRIGRSGHNVGKTSCGVLLPFHGIDLLLGAVMAEAVMEREIEKIKPINNPLDILSQTLLALCTEESFTADELYRVIQKFAVFSGIARSSFDQVLAMLTGKYFPSANNDLKNETNFRLRELKPLLYQDIDGKLYAGNGVLTLLYSSGGVIPGRGLYSMRLPDGTKIGELDEEFVFERRTGDSFDFGSRSWSIVEIGSEAVTVSPLAEAADFQPFWKAGTSFRSNELCKRTLDFFHTFNTTNSIDTKNGLSTEAAKALEDLLSRQRDAQSNIPLPGHKIIPVEIINDPSIRPDAFQVVFHSFRGGAVNYPLAMALSSLIEEKTGMRCETVSDDNAVLLLLPRLASSGRSDPVLLLKNCIAGLGFCGEKHFKKRLESSGIFGAAFREAAGCSMILPRGNFGKRIPLWVMRQRAKRLFDRVASFNDFPVITEAWRNCLSDQFDMESFRALLDSIASGEVELKFFQNTGASPFARELSWKEINNFMYEYDERKDILGLAGKKNVAADKILSSSDRAITDAINNPALRPFIKTSTIVSFTARQRRELPGYAPEDIQSLSQWVKDRIAIPQSEWETLLTSLPFPLQEKLSEDPSLGGRLCTITLPGASMAVTTHVSTAFIDKTAPGPAEILVFLSEWLRFEGPVLPAQIAGVFGCTVSEAEDALDELAETGELVKNVKLEINEDNYYCDTENYELLLRLTRKKSRPQIKEMPVDFLVPFIAMRQGLIEKNTTDNIPLTNLNLDCLSCYPIPARLWETEILPARDPHYRPEKLDTALKNGTYIWFGAGLEKAAFSSPDDLELTAVLNNGHDISVCSELVSLLSKLCTSSISFWEIKDHLQNQAEKPLSNDQVAAAIWEAAWQSKISSDSWESLRRGIEQGFGTGKNPIPHSSAMVSALPGIRPSYQGTGNSPALGRVRRLPHALKNMWREGTPVKGRWYSLESDFDQLSALEQEELNRDRVRLLLRRWGILCRPLLELENFFSWSQLLPAMRRMELSGELVAGRFFQGILSLQFASPSIAKDLEAVAGKIQETTAGPVYWMNAADPASPAAWNIPGINSQIPAKNAGARICFKGKDVAAVSDKNGRNLNIFTGEDEPDIDKVLAFTVFPRQRVCHPVKKIKLETINGKPAAESPYAPLLKNMGFLADRGKLFLW